MTVDNMGILLSLSSCVFAVFKESISHLAKDKEIIRI